ncbi:MAG: hypothetical protein DHS20C16_21600 [Phycisphaerae bacterium]|nr:MAG: hypothetical protein DHS20C16_21600 [Phycisphaerae bacterium]
MQSHKTLRSLVLAVTSLVVVVIIFAVYRSTQPASSNSGLNQPTPPPVVADKTKIEDTITPPIDQTTNATDSRSPLHVGDTQIPVSGGEDVSLTLFDQDGTKRGRLNADEWTPLEGNRFEIVKPIIHLRTPNGQTVRVSADQGLVQLKGNDPRRPDPKRGTLTGNVQIIIDRLSEEQRDLLPPDERYKIDDEREVKIEMEDVTFDLEYARIQTERSFSIESIEAKLAGIGLLLHYNELDNRIEELIVREGKEIEVSGFGGNVRLAGQPGESGTDAEATPPEDPAQLAAEDGEDSADGLATAVGTNGAADADLPVIEIANKQDDDKAKPTDEYTAIFEDDVNIRRFVESKQTGQLLADRLEILFDFGAQEKELAKQSPGSASKQSESTTGDVNSTGSENATIPNESSLIEETSLASGSAKAGLPAKQDERVKLTWSGLLHVTSRRRSQSEGLDPDVRRMHILATGEKVVVRDDQRMANCNKLNYQDETGLVELFGTTEHPAYVEIEQGSSLRGVEIKLDRTNGEAFAKGPGRLVSTRASRKGEPESKPTPSFFAAMTGKSNASSDRFQVDFGGSVNAFFGKTPFTQVDTATGETQTKSVQTLHRAHFTGGVDMRQGAERIVCNRIDIDFALDEQGEIYPIRAHAIENVTVSQGSRFIKAANELIADLKSYEVSKPAFEIGKAREYATERGLDLSKIDWALEEKKYNATKKFRTGLASIFADGTVMLRDPVQELEVDCGKLNCRFEDGQQIESGVVTPEVGRDAFVGMGEFSIAAPTDITFSATKQSAEVKGSGKMTFLTDRDFDGSEQDTPTLVRIMWLEHMNFLGQQNVAHFKKKVHVSTDSSTYDCDALRVDFVDVVKTPAELAKAASNDTQSKWWIFTPLVDSAAGKPGNQAKFKVSGPSFNKDPIFIQATGHVVAENRNMRKDSKRLKSRVQMKGPSMSIDLQKKFVRVDGKGNMLIEDYRAPKNSPQPKSKPATPFGAASRDEPSQTYLGWKDTMHYRYDVNIAQFDKDVQLVHRSGDQMKMAAEILGQREAATLKEGRIATLDAQSLVVQFIRTADDNSLGANRLSGTDVQSFNASGQVYFVDSGISALAQQITYSRDDSILQIIGTKDDPAQLFDERGHFRSQTGPRFEWDRRTNMVRAQNSYGRIN